jgi:hypothetical protein
MNIFVFLKRVDEQLFVNVFPDAAKRNCTLVETIHRTTAYLPTFNLKQFDYGVLDKVTITKRTFRDCKKQPDCSALIFIQATAYDHIFLQGFIGHDPVLYPRKCKEKV